MGDAAVYILQSPKNIHGAIRVGDFTVSKRRIRGIENAVGLVSRDHGYLIIQPFRAAEISLRQIRKDLVSNRVLVQHDHDPAHLAWIVVLRVLAGGTIE